VRVPRYQIESVASVTGWQRAEILKGRYGRVSEGSLEFMRIFLQTDINDRIRLDFECSAGIRLPLLCGST
jgi:hypothetical protein